MDKEPELPIAADVLKPKNNYMIVNIGHYAVVVPHADGMSIVKGLANAEMYDTSNWDNPVVSPIDKQNQIQTTIISQASYLNMKMSHLMGFKVTSNK